MKKIIFALVLLLFVCSCKQENLENEEELVKETSKSEMTPKNFSTINDGYSQREILEINLNWVSYIAGSVLREDAAARQEVATLLQNGNKVIKLNQLLDNNSAFAIKFIERTNLYLFMGYPNHDKTRPNPPPQGIGGGSSNLTAQFIDYILYNHCIELYFPKSVNFVGEFSISTTGHPMNDVDTSNEGIIRYFEPLVVTPFADLLSTTHLITVSYSYLHNAQNVIIARPYRNSNDPITGINCTYIQYNDISDFTDFLEY
ncbi:hypothetical protein KORDIASMS9_03032 [Kordia sp. SMS9]|uniref:hypothetical protein n=1 Tax=Kordia sp. SMS9 TaxID=2282170 RepID=UPI000E0D3D47|nr:hypothetical protein [Kordia sp. SMS9]AXG70786.1 hypothetical protein KORDIASMS9_03032 [Kordia sp. SMS9]